jgi:hypothetical protein
MDPGQRVNQLCRNPNSFTNPSDAAFEHVTDAEFASHLFDVYRFLLYLNDELRAITNNRLKRDNAVMMSSTMPSAKYSRSGSWLIVLERDPAIEGLSGN